ncbi:hypothetical protein CANCADRAFT_44194 [Tortispora caseinolytica NRRL Y-17796]|uniref:PRA1 family protein n=1 Tax=Tortispora caseinolytica NRRL Y-17796 TaxID=767744 RepID=A0A1E4TFI8_9ASCO|nr:hypothetical protein CANCADRAFT_44194 [Tortispora caseinolytica NRRL Y-17796]
MSRAQAIQMLSGLSERLNMDRIRSETQSLQSRLGNLKPPQDFFDVKRMSKPSGFGEVQSRWSYNLSYFSTNYLVLFAMLSVYSLLTNPLLLFVIVLGLGGAYGISMLGGGDLNLGVAQLTTSQLYTGLLVVVIPLTLFASPISTIMWLIGASGVSILGHAAIMDKPIESAFADEAV